MPATTTPNDRGFAPVPRAVLFHPRLTANALKVYAALASFAGTVTGEPNFGKCWPSQRRLAGQLHMNRSTLQESMSLLEREGLIDRQQRKGGNGRNTTSMVTLVGWRDLLTPGPTGGTDPGPRRGSTGTKSVGTKSAEQLSSQGEKAQRRSRPSIREEQARTGRATVGAASFKLPPEAASRSDLPRLFPPDRPVVRWWSKHEVVGKTAECVGGWEHQDGTRTTEAQWTVAL
jgi:DNA-binding transcriptional MocR family regulator